MQSCIYSIHNLLHINVQYWPNVFYGNYVWKSGDCLTIKGPDNILFEWREYCSNTDCRVCCFYGLFVALMWHA